MNRREVRAFVIAVVPALMVDVGAHQPLRERLGPVPATAVLASDMTVNVVSVGMVVLGLVLLVVTLRFWRTAGEDPEVLAPLDLHVPAGQTVALVGPSGSGKSTLVHLLPRLVEPSQGRITLDGVPLDQWDVEALRRQFALVSQDVVLFNDTVAANIAYGTLRETSEAEVAVAAEAAHAMEFIRQMPQGLQTMVGENGVKLSGGQRQRLAIARALLKNAPVLILDEATSALDSESERHVQAALDALMQGRTTIVIAHRLSTIEKAGRIVVLDHGRIAETGNHAELLAKNGIYARLYNIQFKLQETA